MASSQKAANEKNELRSLHRLGEILKSVYQVKAICSDEVGRASYKCERLTDGVGVWVDCMSLGNMVPPNNPLLFEDSKNEMLNATEPNKSPVCDSFELIIQGDVRFYVVREVTPVPINALPKSVQDLEDGLRPQLRRGPEGTRCVVYRKGDCHLEIDVPAEGFVCWTIVLLTTSPIAFPILGVVYFIWGAIAGNLIMLLVSPLAAIIGYAALIAFISCFLVRFIFGHNNLVITPTYFRNKMTLEREPGFKDSVEHPVEAVAELTPRDKIFCKQIAGRTDDILKAALEIPTGYERPDKSLVLLMNSGMKHILYFHLSDSQKHWIVEEINEVLTNIRNQTQTA